MLNVQKTDLFQRWFDRLKDEMLKASIRLRTERIELDGYFGKIYPIKGAKNISEIKIEMGAGYRVYFNLYIEGSEVWLLSGGDKSTQEKDINNAKELLKEIQKEREAKK
ncbi:MAG: type II toxin-antitoxin system RelE/ParE family toxin [Campylobacteraceae bacterium]|jgi:putative addiction module killer protein|nr:type II toxin-antitoxin system RelE/ParE family toxin [Campylobacteraceae bacterium]